ncbi:hypothetical protein ACFIQG_08855 [Comamonas odontotermitis]|uniref:hypothetical protein n=1 Tax=Comamonas odontotermitis TaxID=379895 RepID=UPI00366F8BE7
MNTDQILAQYLSDVSEVTSKVANTLQQPRARQLVYKELLAKPRLPFHSLLRHLLQEEVMYRNALWNLEVQDDDNHFEGIYRCAYLLGGCADPSDTLLLWDAKFINMDVGTSMGAEFFIGAGLHETLAYLSQCSAKDAAEIREYVWGYFSDADALKWQKDWEEERITDIRSI